MKVDEGLKEVIGIVIKRWQSVKLISFNDSYNDGSDDLIFRNEIARAVTGYMLDSNYCAFLDKRRDNDPA